MNDDDQIEDGFCPEPSDEAITNFRGLVLAHYARHARDLPWRRTNDPYLVLVSEVMLQQTQVPRVIKYYEEWARRFPTVRSLAEAPLGQVLEAWQGLGYNRRALHLKRAAEEVVERFDGQVPSDLSDLMSLPGVGRATAAAVAAFAFGEAYPYIETNIRAVMLHHFFGDREDVPDSEIMQVVECTLDREDPRTWYYALMDYGVHLKQLLPNPSRRSRHHARQKPFEGSRRQKRAEVLRTVLGQGTSDETGVAAVLGMERSEAREVLDELAREGFLAEDETGRYRVR